MELEEAARLESLGEKWGVNVPELQARIVALTREQAQGVLDAIAAFWASDLPFDTGLSDAGLV